MNLFFILRIANVQQLQAHKSWSYGGIVAWLVVFFIIADCFWFVFIPEAVPKLLHWGLDAFLLLWFSCQVIYQKITQTILRRYRFVRLFMLLVIVTMVNAYVLYGQTFDQSFRVIGFWFEYIMVFWLVRKKFSVDSLYYAAFVFSFMVWGLWLYTLLSGNIITLMDVADSDLEGGRGIERIKISGGAIPTLFGFWSMGKYVKYNKPIYLIIFFISAMMSLFSVSRQHIVAFGAISILFFFQGFALYKKMILIAAVAVFFHVVLPQISIYQRLQELTEQQFEQNEGMKEDVRTRAAIYYTTEFDQSLYTKLCGNCKYHADSSYGKHIGKIIRLHGFVLSDIGLVGLYIYFGIAGLLLFGYILYWTWKSKTDEEYRALKYMIYYLFLGSILSHSLETTTFITPIAFFLIGTGYRRKRRNNQRLQNCKKC